MFKSIIRITLEWYVKKYFKRHPDVKLVVVTGSVGKTTTKIAIGTVLSEGFRVRLHEGNYNSEISTPLAILGIELPDSLRHIGAWLAVFRAASRRVREPADVDVIVQEIGSDRIGQVAHAGTFLHPDIAVVTAVAPEHMEYFGTIENVAKEELAAANFSKQVLINRDDIDGMYAEYVTNPDMSTYGSTRESEYHFVVDGFHLDSGFEGSFVAKDWDTPTQTTITLIGDHSIRPAVAAGAVAVKLGLTPKQVATGLAKVRAVNGRMNVLRGVNGTTIIDDTYNSSPLAATSALQTLYDIDATQKIAVIGDMNELGDSSADEHKKLGEFCDPNGMTWLITVGPQTEAYVAPIAKQKGCQVRSFRSPIEAGAFVHRILQSSAVVLFKGSEGGIFLEEAVKVILHSTDDEHRLVRQSAAWMQRKQQFYDNGFKWPL